MNFFWWSKIFHDWWILNLGWFTELWFNGNIGNWISLVLRIASSWPPADHRKKQWILNLDFWSSMNTLRKRKHNSRVKKIVWGFLESIDKKRLRSYLIRIILLVAICGSCINSNFSKIMRCTSKKYTKLYISWKWFILIQILTYLINTNYNLFN